MIDRPTLQSGTADRSVEAMSRLVAGLHLPYLNDLLDDDIDDLLGADAGPTGIAGSRPPLRPLSLKQFLRPKRSRQKQTPGGQPPMDRPAMYRRAVNMRRTLPTLVDMAERRAAVGPELGDAVQQADRLCAREVSEDTVDLVYLRHLALAMLELVECLAVEDHQPPPDFKPKDAAPRGWWA